MGFTESFKINGENLLKKVKELIEEGKFVPVTDRIYPLERIADAYSYVMTGQKVGNVVIIMDN